MIKKKDEHAHFVAKKLSCTIKQCKLIMASSKQFSKIFKVVECVKDIFKNNGAKYFLKLSLYPPVFS